MNKKRIKKYFKETWRNKIVAVIILLCGIFVTAISKDANALVLVIFLAVRLFFAKENWILSDKN